MNPIVTKAVNSIISAYKADRDHLVRLDEDFYAGMFAETFPWEDDAGNLVQLPILDFRCDAFSIVDRKLVCYKAKEPRSDGATLAPDKVGKVDLAAGYIPHDDLYAAMSKIAEDPTWKAAGWTADAVRALADAVLSWMILFEEKRVHPDRPPWIHRVCYAAVRAFGGIVHRIGIRCLVLFAALAVAECGCAPLPEVFTPSGERPVYTVVKRGATAASDPLPAPIEETDAGVHAGAADGASSDPATGGSGSDAVASSGVAVSISSSPSLDFRFGGFKGDKAKEDPRCRIGSPKITKDKISWKWESKIPSDWKRFATSKGPMVVSAAFYWDETAGKWIGGKMDWCDEARTSRDTAHIHDGYNGWQGAGWDKAKKRAFCVVSADGLYRSNLIED